MKVQDQNSEQILNFCNHAIAIRSCLSFGHTESSLYQPSTKSQCIPPSILPRYLVTTPFLFSLSAMPYDAWHSELDDGYHHKATPHSSLSFHIGECSWCLEHLKHLKDSTLAFSQLPTKSNAPISAPVATTVYYILKANACTGICFQPGHSKI